MILEEAIKHAKEVAERKKEEACNLYDDKNYEESRECIWCAEEHRQLAEWLNDYKRLLEQEPILDKIRAEIKLKIVKRPWLDFKDRERDRNDAFLEVLDIIDKYKTESEDD